MSPEKENFHVVIRIPCKRPKGFLEPPSIIWTDEMEHKLWQYMSQKNTDWKVIAEQLGVPTSYIVRHAAFIYETQLRGLHQQLRINVNNNSMSRNSAKSPAPSLRRPSSIRYSQQQQYQHDGSISPIEAAPLSPEQMTRSTSHSLYQSSSSRLNETDEEEFSSHFERMRVQAEEPAFLPRRLDGSTSNLTSSRQQISQSIQNLKKDSPKKDSSPPAPGSSNQSVIHSSTSSFSDISESSVTQSAMEDAFILNFTHGSKTSLLGFSRKFR